MDPLWRKAARFKLRNSLSLADRSKVGTFVFVVCGAEEHIDTLHFSLRYLKHFSDSGIIVLTDSTRNAKPVVHDRIIDVKTPEEFSQRTFQTHKDTSGIDPQTTPYVQKLREP